MTADQIKAEIERAVKEATVWKRERMEDAAGYQRDHAANPKNWHVPPASPETMGLIYDRMISEQTGRFANVKVVEQGGQFYLDYGDEDRTGGFMTREGAEGWFLGGGR